MERPRCSDAIVIVPGIGGSELLRGDELVWGGTLKALASGLLTGSLFDDLRRDDLCPGGPLRVPTHLPVFGHFDPYSKLIEALRKLALDPDAVMAFAYDWRRSVSDGAKALAVAAGKHLDRWRRHRLGSREAQLSLVCHSLGGLVARQYAEVLGGRASIRQIVTLGTPFGGSVKAVRALADGRVLKGGLRSRKLRELARELPSVHDLLPTYPAVATSAGNRRPTQDDLAATGTSRDLIREAAGRRERLTRALSENGASSCPVVPLDEIPR